MNPTLKIEPDILPSLSQIYDCLPYACLHFELLDSSCYICPFLLRCVIWKCERNDDYISSFRPLSVNICCYFTNIIVIVQDYISFENFQATIVICFNPLGNSLEGSLVCIFKISRCQFSPKLICYL